MIWQMFLWVAGGLTGLLAQVMALFAVQHAWTCRHCGPLDRVWAVVLNAVVFFALAAALCAAKGW